MVTLGKWQGDCYIQSDRYMQVNFAQKLRQLKILGINYPVTVIYRVTTIYRGVIQIWLYVNITSLRILCSQVAHLQNCD